MKALSYEQQTLLRQQARLNQVREEVRQLRERIAEIDARMEPLRVAATRMVQARQNGSREYTALGARIRQLKEQKKPYGAEIDKREREIYALKKVIQPQVQSWMELVKARPDEAEHTTLLRRVHRMLTAAAAQDRIVFTDLEQVLLDEVKVTLGELSFLHERSACNHNGLNRHTRHQSAPLDPATRTEQNLKSVEQVARSRAVGLK